MLLKKKLISDRSVHASLRKSSKEFLNIFLHFLHFLQFLNIFKQIFLGKKTHQILLNAVSELRAILNLSRHKRNRQSIFMKFFTNPYPLVKSVFTDIDFLVACYTTLHPALSGWSRFTFFLFYSSS